MGELHDDGAMIIVIGLGSIEVVESVYNHFAPLPMDGLQLLAAFFYLTVDYSCDLRWEEKRISSSCAWLYVTSSQTAYIN